MNVLLFHVLALALETGTDTSTGGTDTTTGDTTGDTTTDTETTGDCGSCSGETLPTITSPAEGAMVGSPFTVTFDLGVACSCDDCGCFDDQAMSYTILANDAAVASGQAGESSAELALAAGTYELVLRSDYSFHSVSSEPVTVTVGEGADGADQGSEGEGGGKGCSASEGVPPTLALLALVGLLGLRRRRR